MLVDKHRKAKNGDGDDKEIRAAIERAIDSSPSLRNKKDLIEAFVDSLSATAEVDVAWQAFVAAQRREELDRIIDEENLKPEATYAFVETSFRDGSLQPSGTAVTKILPPFHASLRTGVTPPRSAQSSTSSSRFFERFQGLGG